MCRVRVEISTIPRALHGALDRFPDRLHLREQDATALGAWGDAARRLQRVDEALHHRHVAVGILPDLVEGVGHEVS